MPVLSSYRNQSTNLHSKSIGWFLYEGNTSQLICTTNQLLGFYMRTTLAINELKWGRGCSYSGKLMVYLTEVIYMVSTMVSDYRLAYYIFIW